MLSPFHDAPPAPGYCIPLMQLRAPAALRDAMAWNLMHVGDDNDTNDRPMNTKRLVSRLAIALVATWMLGGCAAVALTTLGVGMATGVSHTLGGIVYKTFTAPQTTVRKATMTALNRMQIQVTKTKRTGSSETITARAGDRDVEIELESLTPNTTRMNVTARKDAGILRDGATATEIILQTERVVGPA